MSIYDTLNSEQKRAVLQTDGPVLILAGAGSGKTRVITHRIAYLMEECGVNPWNILAITFTNKAAGEMRERVDRLIGFGAESVWVSTFHSMCVRILRRHIDAIGYDNRFTIYDTDDQKALMKQVCKELNIDTKQLRERSILSAISSAKDELLTPLRYQEKHQMDFIERQIGDAYELYQKMLQKNNALDFDDLLMKTVELFNAREDILKNYQDRFRYIMVDEYQDTNTAQFEIVRLLASGSRNLCVVGDDDQSIYKFRGANIRNILDFEKVYPDATVIRLEQNYRSTQNILDAANAVIANNRNRKAKKLWTDRGPGNKVHFRQFRSGRDEASYVAEDIDRCMRQDHKLHYRDFAVLYRTNAQSRQLEDSFVQNSVPYNIVGGTNFYARMEVRDLLSYLRTVSNGLDDISVQRIINVPKRGIGETTIGRIQDYAQSHEVSFFDALSDLDEIPGVAKAKKKLTDFRDFILSLRDFASTNRIEELIKKIIRDTDYENYLRAYDELTADDRIDNINELISKAVSYEEDALEDEESGGPTLAGFLEDVALVADIDNVDGDDDRVLLMTLHSAKGLEFPHVYLTGMEEDLFPSYMSLNSTDEDALEEERRLAYVGITRAKDDLTLCCASARMVRGEMQYHAISRFVMEIPENLLDCPPGKDYSVDTADWEDEDDEPPFADIHGRMPASGAHGGGYDVFAPYGGSGSVYGRKSAADRGKESSSFGAGGRGQGTSYSAGGAHSSREESGTGSGRGVVHPHDARLKAVYVKPHTSSAKKPAIAKAGLSALSKGMPEAAKPDYEVGDRVAHVKYGSGTVLSIEKGPRDYKVKVMFDEAGQKIMYAAFAKLRKI